MRTEFIYIPQILYTSTGQPFLTQETFSKTQNPAWAANQLLIVRVLFYQGKFILS